MGRRIFIASDADGRLTFCQVVGRTLFVSHLIVGQRTTTLLDALNRILFLDAETGRGYHFENKVASAIKRGEQPSVDDVPEDVVRRCVSAVKSIMGGSPISAN